MLKTFETIRRVDGHYQVVKVQGHSLCLRTPEWARDFDFFVYRKYKEGGWFIVDAGSGYGVTKGKTASTIAEIKEIAESVLTEVGLVKFYTKRNEVIKTHGLLNQDGKRFLRRICIMSKDGTKTIVVVIIFLSVVFLVIDYLHQTRLDELLR